MKLRHLITGALPACLLSLGVAASAAATGQAAPVDGAGQEATALVIAPEAGAGQQAPALVPPEIEAALTVKPLRPERPGLSFGGYFWNDVGAMSRVNQQAGAYDQIANYMQGRFVLRSSFYREFKSFYALARAELVAFENEYSKASFEPHTQDTFLEVGQDWWDVQVGRFLGWEVYHRGQGMELFTADETGAATAPSLYWLEQLRGYKNEAGQAAVHLFPFDFMGIELGAVYGQENNQNNIGLRPVVDLRFNGLQLIGGYEYFRQVPQIEADKVEVTTSGFAGRVQYVLPLRDAGREWPSVRYASQTQHPLNLAHRDALRIGVNAATTSVEYIDIQGNVEGAKTFDKTSVGAFVDLDLWRNTLGLGYHRTTEKNLQGETSTHDQAFVSWLYRIPIEGLYVKAVYGWALGHIEDIDTRSSYDNAMHSFRLRLAYEFL